jgi:hypothetical protein
MFESRCPSLVPFICELSLEVFSNFVLGDKGAYNILAFALSPHGRDAFYRGYFQWGPNIQSPFFPHYDLLFRKDKNDYYSFGDKNKNREEEEWIRSILFQSVEGKKIHPYLQSIIDMYTQPESIGEVFSKEASPKHNKSSTLLHFPFNTVLISTTSSEKEESNTLENHKKLLLQILSHSCSDLPWKAVFPNDKNVYKHHEIENLGCITRLTGVVNFFILILYSFIFLN